MFARAAITVATCADFVVEGAVDFVLLRSEDGGEIVGHFGDEFMRLILLFLRAAKDGLNAR